MERIKVVVRRRTKVAPNWKFDMKGEILEVVSLMNTLPAVSVRIEYRNLIGELLCVSY